LFIVSFCSIGFKTAKLVYNIILDQNLTRFLTVLGPLYVNPCFSGSGTNAYCIRSSELQYTSAVMLISVVYFREGAAGMSGPDPSLGSFFKEVSHAPSLPSLPPSEPLADCLQTWTNQLPAYESNLNEYEELLNQIGSSSEQEDDQL
jgi:hypothetical protein